MNEHEEKGPGSVAFEHESAENRADPRDKTIDDVLESLGGAEGDDITLKVFRKDEAGARRWIWDYELSDLPLERKLAERAGGGDYTVEIWGKTPNGGHRISKRGSARILIEKTVKAKPQAADAPAAPAADLAAVLKETMSGMQSVMLSAVERVAQSSDAKIEQVLQRIQTAGPGAGALTLQSVLEILPIVKQLIGGGESKSPLQQLKELAALKSDLAELIGEGGGDGWNAGTAMKVLEGLKDLVRTRPPAPPAERVHVPSPDTDATHEGLAMFEAQIKEHLLYLCSKAAKGRNASELADDTMDLIPDAFDDQLLEWLGDSDAAAVENLARICPEVANFKPWFTSFCTALRSHYDDGGDGHELTVAESSRIDTGKDSALKAPHASNTAAEAGGSHKS